LEFLKLWEDEDVVKLEIKETVKPSKLCGLANTLKEQQKKQVDEMELTQSNPQN